MVGPILRGEVRWGDFNPVVGHEQAGRRPLLVIQNNSGNEYSPTVIVAVITSRIPQRDYPFLVALPPATLSRPCVVDCAQIRTIDKSRLLGEAAATLQPHTMAAVDEALRVSLGFF